ncbi:MAG: tetratricopeptide repeat protein, partial [Bacteroidota bacterium]
MDTASADIKKIASLNKEAWAIVRSNPKKCLELSKELLDLSENAGHAEGMAMALSGIGGAYVWLSKYDEALQTLFSAREAFRILGDKAKEAHVVYHIFCSYYFLADYDKALSYANEILSLADAKNESQAKANAYNGMGTIYYTIGENEKAVENLLKAFELAKNGNDKHLLARITDGIGQAYLQMNDLQKALVFKEKSWEAAKASGRKNEIGYALNGLASVYHSTGNFTKSEEFYRAAVDLRKEIGFKPGVADSLSSLGNLFLDENRDEEALYCLQEALAVAEEIDSKEYLSKIHLSLSRYYERKNNFPAYKKQLDLYYSNKELTLNEQNRQKLKTAGMQMKMEQVEKEKQLLEKKHMEVERAARHTKMISEIGKDIASLLSADEIIETVYRNIHELMDADAFGIGIYRAEHHDLFHTGVMEKGNKLPDFSFPLDEERIASVCFHQKKEIIINDWNREFQQYVKKNYSAKAGEAPVSMIYMPLMAGNHIIGVMSVQSFKINAYNSYHVDILRSLSLYIGKALENANLYEQMEERVQERTAEIEKAYENTRLLSRISKEISSSLSIETIIELVYKNINQLMDADGFGIGLLDKSAGQIHFPGYIEKGEKISFSIDTNDDRLATWCLNRQEQIFINNFPEEYSKYLKLKQAPKAGKDSSSIIYLPLYLKDTITGVITVQSFQVNAYTEYHL